MKNLRRLALAVLVTGAWVFSVSAEARAADPGAVADKGAPAARFTRIVYSDSGGFTGKGTGKWLSIDADGKLQLKKRNGAEVEAQLDKEDLADLTKKVSAVDWASVQKQYPSRGADMIQNDLVVMIDGKTHGVHAVAGSAGIPPALKTLFMQLATLYRQFAVAKGEK